MPVIRITLLTLFTVVLIGTLCPAAQAQVTLTTPFVGANGGQILDCLVTNVWTNPLTVAVTLTDFDGTVLTRDFDGCGSALSPGRSCEVFLPPDEGAFCTVTASNTHLTASINVFGPRPAAPLITVVPATAVPATR